MPYIIGFVSQKGGVGKSTLARLLAREVAAGGASVKIADLDIQQATSYHWAKRRAKHAVEPQIRIETFASVKTALADAPNFDVFILDGEPHASTKTKEIAKGCDLIVIPTAQGLDDLEPSVLLAHDLQKDGIPIDRIVFALCKVTDSDAEVRGAREYLIKAGYKVLAGDIPVRTAFSKAHDEGRAVTETPFATLSKKADEVAQSLIDAVSSSSK